MKKPAFLSKLQSGENGRLTLKNLPGSVTRPGAWLTVTLLCFAVVFTLLTLLLPKKDFSERENRKLADKPSLSLSVAADGSLARGTESWFADHFIGRDFWTSLNLRYKLLLGQKENGGVYLGKKKTLFLIPSEPDEASLTRNLAAMDAFAAANGEIRTYVAVIPNAYNILSDRLPSHAPVPDQAAQLQRIAAALPHATFLDTTDALSARKDEPIFYKTDHHWTSLGAYTAFTAMAGPMGIENPVTEYDIYPVSTTFTGTLASKSGRYQTADTVEIYAPKTDVIYNVTYVDEMRKTATMYEQEALEHNDHYAVFFGGNYPRVDISTTAGTGRRLLLFKDSYANCMVQFLYPYFDQIVMIDPRYYYENAQPLVTQQAVTDVLYLYNCDTFLTDASIADVLAQPAAAQAPAAMTPTDAAEVG